MSIAPFHLHTDPIILKQDTQCRRLSLDSSADELLPSSNFDVPLVNSVMGKVSRENHRLSRSDLHQSTTFCIWVEHSVMLRAHHADIHADDA